MGNWRGLVILCGLSIAIATGPAARANELVVSQGVDPIGFDPTRFATGNHVFLHQLYDTLVTLGPDGEPRAGLAESWQRSPDGLTVTFRPRR